MTFTPQKRRIIGFVPTICYALVFSYTTKVSISPFRRRIVPSNLLFSVDGPSDHVISDSELISSIVNAKTTHEVGKTLRDAFERKLPFDGDEMDVDGDEVSLSPLDFDREYPVLEAETETLQLDEASINAAFSKFPQFSLNITAAALRRLAHVSLLETKSTNPDPETLLLQKDLIASLLRTIGSQIIITRRSPTTSLGVPAMSDILQGLAVLSNENNLEHLQPLAKVVAEAMACQDERCIYNIGPIRLVQCLQAMAKLKIMEDQPLRHIIYRRLLRPDAVSRIPAPFLSHGLNTLASFGSKDSDTFLLARSFMRRLRKQQVRKKAKIEDLCRALVAGDSLLKNGCMEGHEDEASIFGFTTLREILRRQEEFNHTFTPVEMSNMFVSWGTFSSGDREDTMIEELIVTCQQQKTLEHCDIYQVGQIVSSIEKLRFADNSEIIKAAGERLSKLVITQQKEPDLMTFDPNIINKILRCSVLLNRRNTAVMEPFLLASSILFTDKRFLENCRILELSNFLWFMSIAHWKDEAALAALVERILDPTLVDACSPKLASRILVTYTNILSTFDSNGNGLSGAFLETTPKLFHEYGGHLLTTQLTPAEVSTSLYAYAKSSYWKDMGIYDHLVSLIASMKKKSTVRQLTQSLWSCGKMIEWDNMDIYGVKIDSTPPYFVHAQGIARELSLRQSELSPVDVTQCIWALGRLGIRDPAVVDALARRAEQHADSMNSVEIANILWGLAKIGFNDPDSAVISTLSLKLTSGSLEVTPKSAATALYALGKLEIKDEKIYRTLSNIMVSQIDKASAQSVANALWAHQRVELRPPREMVDLWTAQKLGGFGLTFLNSKHEILD